MLVVGGDVDGCPAVLGELVYEGVGFVVGGLGLQVGFVVEG